MQFMTFAARCLSFPALLSVDPLRIATNAEAGNRISVTGEESNGFLGLFSFGNLYYVLKREVFIWGTIVTVFLLVTMLFVTKSERLAERKADVLHKLIVVFLASSSITILSLFVNLLDAVF